MIRSVLTAAGVALLSVSPLVAQQSGRDETTFTWSKHLAAGSQVSGHVGDAEPLMAIEDAVNRERYDEIVISTLPRRISRWLHLDLVSKARGLGLPVTHVEAQEEARAASG